MSRSSTLILLGVLVVLAPFSGLPMNIRSLLSVLFGAGIVVVGLSMRMRTAPTTPQSIAEVLALPIEAPPERKTKGGSSTDTAVEPPHEMSAI